MPINVDLVLSPKQAADKQLYTSIAARQVNVPVSRIALVRVLKRSIDSRSKSPKVNLRLEIYVDQEKTPEPINFEYPFVGNSTPIIIVGSGPAGLFAALRLIEKGLKPIILERGKDVSERKRDIAKIHKNEEINPDSNYSFGEGGAGTYSDGKLFTRSKKRGDYHKALQTLIFHGANPEIIIDAHPHIGSDRLPRIIANIRQTIVESGGEFHFNMKVTDFIIQGDRCKGVKCGDEVVEGAAVIIAAGHSAKDIYQILHEKEVLLEAKAFAMGVRVEHSQTLIDSIQYHRPERGEYLPAAAYSLVSQVAGRGVYSFCMCPGGFIVPAMTSSDQTVVNGMSPSHRGSPYANSAIVTEIRLSDYEHLVPKYGVLAGLYYQEELERQAKLHSELNKAPAQRLADFVSRRKSSSLPKTSYVPGLVNSDLHNWLPPLISNHLRGGFQAFGHKMRGFLTNDAIILGVESRTSTPVRIPRDRDTLAHPQISNLFPAGEGAGYAGGILSAAIDGENVANSVFLLF